MCSDGAPRLADDQRMRNLPRVAHARDAVHHVAGVLVERVVHRRCEVGAAAVVVDAEAAAHVDVLEAGAHLLELRVHVCQLVDGFLHAADVLQLAARMAVHELQAVEHAARAQHLDELEDLGDEQAELRTLARRLAPATRAFARELHAHADARPDGVRRGVAQDEVELRKILDHRNDGAAELGGEDHRLDVARVLETVADDQAVGRVLGHGHDREQLGLGAHLEAEAELLAVAVHLFDHEALLVHLDREHGRVAVLVFVFGDGLREGIVQVAQAVNAGCRRNVRPPACAVARRETLHHFVQVDFARRGGIGPHDDVTGRVDGEVALAPGSHVIEIEESRSSNPGRRGLASLRFRRHGQSQRRFQYRGTREHNRRPLQRRRQ